MSLLGSLLGDKPLLDDDDQDEDPDASEGEGVDLHGDGTGDDDSSEEDEDDSEEEREVRKGFIVDEDETSSRKRSKKKKRRKHRGSDEEGSSRKRRKDSDDDDGDLDEDDLALLEENTGVKLTGRSKGKLKRLRRRRSASDVSDRSAPELNDIFNDDDRQMEADDGEGLPFDQDEMAGFIEDDTASESSGRAGSDSEDEESRAARKAAKRKSKTKTKGRRAGFGAGFVEGITAEAWQEVTEVFGNGQDYAFAMEEEEEDKGEKELKDIFEPSEIASRMLTEEDDRIRGLDIPERLQLASVGIPPTDPDDNVAPFIPEEDVESAAEWMSTRISNRASETFLLKNEVGDLPPLNAEFIEAVRNTVRFLNIEFLEVPFIWLHRGDFLVHRGIDGSPDAVLLDQVDVWRIATLSIKYRALAHRRAELRKLYRLLEEDDDYFEDVFSMLESVEEVADANEWLGMKFSKKLSAIKNARDAEGEDGAATNGRKKRATRESAYDDAKATVVSKLAELISISATDLSQAFVTGKPVDVQDPESMPLVLAEEHTGDGYSSAESALAAAKMIAVHEIAHDPFLKKEARRYFKDYGVVTVTPTDKGSGKIDEVHPFYAFKYLLNKPLGTFHRSAQFLQILTAEKEGLVKSRILLPEAAKRRLVDELGRIYRSDYSSSVAEAWNSLRSEILQTVIEDHLMPLAERWARDYLKEEEEEYVGRLCSAKLESRVNVAPYYRQDGSMERGDIPSVLALSHGNGDPKRDSVIAVFLDPEGHFREHLKIDNLFNPEEAQRVAFSELLRRRRPQITVVGGFSPNTKRLMTDFVAFAQGVSEAIVADGDDDTYDDRLTTEQKIQRARFDATYVYDDVARIYQNSGRASLEFPDLSKLGKYCVGLARYAQSPLNEYAALGSDLTALTYDVNQKFLSREKVTWHLERALVEVVNKVGVDINKAIRNAYYHHLLPFVAGLGPRKADGIVKKINSNCGGTLTNREGLITNTIMTKNIFMNAAGFLRIPQDDLAADLGRKNEESDQPEALDDTRIHPEDYDVARKMAADAMEADEEDLAGNKVPSQAVIDLMESEPEKLDDLSLDDFADELRKLLGVPKRLTLYNIRDEMQRPYAETRADFTSPSALEIFTMLSGETPATLDRGLIIPVRVVRARQDDTIMVRLDSGIEGTIGADYRSDNRNSYVKPKPGQTIQALVIELRLETFEVELSTQEGQIQVGDWEHRRVRADPNYYDNDAADAERVNQEATAQKAAAAGGRQKRVIKHPNFQNINAGQAEEYLAHMQRGDCVIRPSSKEDHLAVTWKVSDGIYQHIAVHELDKPNQFALGSTLAVSPRFKYSDLDELIVSHIKAMASMVNAMTAHDRFKGTETDLDYFLKTYTMANPGKSMYGFAFAADRKKAGEFVVKFRVNASSDIVAWPIKIIPGLFTLLGEEHGDMMGLSNAFKQAYLSRMSQNAPTGKTPMVGGSRTPAVAGGRTPMAGARTPGYGGGRTPNPYASGSGSTPNVAPGQGRTPMAVASGRTPNPYAQGGGGRTPAYNGGGMTPYQGNPQAAYGGGGGHGPPPAMGGPGYGAPPPQHQQQQQYPPQPAPPGGFQGQTAPGQGWGMRQQHQQQQGGYGGGGGGYGGGQGGGYGR